MAKIVITAPSLDPLVNVSGISSVTSFIIGNNRKKEYVHFQVGKTDGDKGMLKRISTTLKALRNWTMLMKHNRDIVIHYNFPLSTMSILRDPLFIAISRMFGRKMLLHIHGGPFLMNQKVPVVLDRILSLVFSSDTPVIVLSDKEKNIIQSRYQCNRVYSLPNCVDLQDAALFKRQIDPERPLQILYLGRITRTKGMDHILEAAISLKNKGVDFVFNLAGEEDPGAAYIEKFTTALGVNFSYLGIVSGEKKNTLLKNCDVFLLPSYFEGLPMSLIECMSYGMIPVVTKVGSIETVVTHGQNGLFIPVKDGESIVSAITAILSDTKTRKRLSQEARNRIFSQFDAEKYISDLNGIYELTRAVK